MVTPTADVVDLTDIPEITEEQLAQANLRVGGKPVQFVVDDKGQRTAVLLDIRAWEVLIKWIETITDTKVTVQALSELQQAGGRPEQAGWLAWDEISEEWGGEEEVETT